MAPQSNIHLYTTGTPNGWKISIMLEELGYDTLPSPEATHRIGGQMMFDVR